MPSRSVDVLSRLGSVVPPALAERAEARLPSTTPVPAALSASVVLLRDQGDGLETYLLHRHARMAFAASMVVFPGGRLDPVDREGDPDPVRACAVRETREETGVQLRPQDLWPWAHWVTPEIEPRRFETYFFLAALPVGAAAADISGETDRAEWRTPQSTLDAASRGELQLMPPTWSILIELADAPSLPELRRLARDRVVERVLPEVLHDGGGWRFRYPAPEFGRDPA